MNYGNAAEQQDVYAMPPSVQANQTQLRQSNLMQQQQPLQSFQLSMPRNSMVVAPHLPPTLQQGGYQGLIPPRQDQPAHQLSSFARQPLQQPLQQFPGMLANRAGRPHGAGNFPSDNIAHANVPMGNPAAPYYPAMYHHQQQGNVPGYSSLPAEPPSQVPGSLTLLQPPMRQPPDANFAIQHPTYNQGAAPMQRILTAPSQQPQPPPTGQPPRAYTYTPFAHNRSLLSQVNAPPPTSSPVHASQEHSLSTPAVATYQVSSQPQPQVQPALSRRLPSLYSGNGDLSHSSQATSGYISSLQLPPHILVTRVFDVSVSFAPSVKDDLTVAGFLSAGTLFGDANSKDCIILLESVKMSRIFILQLIFVVEKELVDRGHAAGDGDDGDDVPGLRGSANMRDMHETFGLVRLSGNSLASATRVTSTDGDGSVGLSLQMTIDATLMLRKTITALPVLRCKVISTKAESSAFPVEGMELFAHASPIVFHGKNWRPPQSSTQLTSIPVSTSSSQLLATSLTLLSPPKTAPVFSAKPVKTRSNNNNNNSNSSNNRNSSSSNNNSNSSKSFSNEDLSEMSTTTTNSSSAKSSSTSKADANSVKNSSIRNGDRRKISMSSSVKAKASNEVERRMSPHHSPPAYKNRKESNSVQPDQQHPSSSKRPDATGRSSLKKGDEERGESAKGVRKSGLSTAHSSKSGRAHQRSKRGQEIAKTGSSDTSSTTSNSSDSSSSSSSSDSSPSKHSEQASSSDTSGDSSKHTSSIGDAMEQSHASGDRQEQKEPKRGKRRHSSTAEEPVARKRQPKHRKRGKK